MYGNGEIRPIYQQGTTTQVGAGVIIYMPERGNNASIAALNFNSSAACSFSLFRVTQITGQLILLYSFELNASDIVSDTVGYHLSSLSKLTRGNGDYFWLVPHSGHVNYTVSGLEYEQIGTIHPPFGTSGTISVINKYGQPKCCSSSSGEYDCIEDTITEETNTYQNDLLIGATNVKFIIIDKQIFTFIDGDYTFNPTTGEITTISVTMYLNTTIVIPHNKPI